MKTNIMNNKETVSLKDVMELIQEGDRIYAETYGDDKNDIQYNVYVMRVYNIRADILGLKGKRREDWINDGINELLDGYWEKLK